MAKKKYSARERKAYWFGYANGQHLDSFNESFASLSKEERESYYNGYEAVSATQKILFEKGKKESKP